MPLPWIFQDPLKSVGKAIAMKNCASDTKTEGGKGELKNKLGTS